MLKQGLGGAIRFCPLALQSDYLGKKYCFDDSYLIEDS